MENPLIDCTDMFRPPEPRDSATKARLEARLSAPRETKTLGDVTSSLNKAEARRLVSFFSACSFRETTFCRAGG